MKNDLKDSVHKIQKKVSEIVISEIKAGAILMPTENRSKSSPDSNSCDDICSSFVQLNRNYKDHS